jgi:cysteine synthase A
MTVVGVEPAASPFLSTGHPAPHDFQGMGPDFIPTTLDREIIDAVESVGIDEAEAECRRLAAEEGILAGQSSGAAAIGARRIAERHSVAPSDTPSDGGDDYLVVTLLPDTGERYLSAGLFE